VNEILGKKLLLLLLQPRSSVPMTHIHRNINSCSRHSYTVAIPWLASCNMSQTPFPQLANGSAETSKPVSTLKYDSEVAAVIATTHIPPPPSGTIAERRAFADKAFGEFLKATRPPLARKVTQKTHYATAQDGYNVPIYHFSARTTRASKPASAILFIHGGGIF